jgi:multisite-specific tRNA:(cytosine-C5)-methyltransferase
VKPCSRRADTDASQAIIENNDYSRLRIISAGVKAFVRQDSQNRTEIGCKWRIPGEGVAEVLPHVGDGVVKVATIEDLRVLVEHAYPSVSALLPRRRRRRRPFVSGTSRPLWGQRAKERMRSFASWRLGHCPLSDLARRSVSIVAWK